MFGVFGLFLAPATSTSLSNVLLAEILAFGCFGVLMCILHALVAAMLYQRIETNKTELIVQRGLLRRSISWKQAHLFATDRTADAKSNASNWDELSDGQHVVLWKYDAESSPRTTLTFSPAEYSQELVCLMSYIHAKTDLPCAIYGCSESNGSKRFNECILCLRIVRFTLLS